MLVERLRYVLSSISWAKQPVIVYSVSVNNSQYDEPMLRVSNLDSPLGAPLPSPRANGWSQSTRSLVPRVTLWHTSLSATMRCAHQDPNRAEDRSGRKFTS